MVSCLCFATSVEIKMQAWLLSRFALRFVSIALGPDGGFYRMSVGPHPAYGYSATKLHKNNFFEPK